MEEESSLEVNWRLGFFIFIIQRWKKFKIFGIKGLKSQNFFEIELRRMKEKWKSGVKKKKCELEKKKKSQNLKFFLINLTIGKKNRSGFIFLPRIL